MRRPELGGGQFTHTLIGGSYDVDDDMLGDSIFTEPMVTSDFMANLDREVVAPVALPAEVPQSGYYPTEYSIRHSADEGLYKQIVVQGESTRYILPVVLEAHLRDPTLPVEPSTNILIV